MEDIWLAISNGSTSRVMELMREPGFDVNQARDSYKMTPLMHAICMKHDNMPFILNMFVSDSYIKINAQDRVNQTALVYAVLKNNEVAVKALLNADGIDLNLCSNNKQSALYLAADRGYDSIVQLLIAKHGCQIDARSNVGATPLMRAAFRGCHDIVKTLLAAEADFALKDSSGRTALSWASYGGHSEIVDALLEAGADINDADVRQQTPLIWAVRYGFVEVVRRLLRSKRLDIDAQDASGQTALICAAEKDDLEIYRALIDRNANIHLQYYVTGSTAAMKAGPLIRQYLDEQRVIGTNLDEGNHSRYRDTFFELPQSTATVTGDSNTDSATDADNIAPESDTRRPQNGF